MFKYEITRSKMLNMKLGEPNQGYPAAANLLSLFISSGRQHEILIGFLSPTTHQYFQFPFPEIHVAIKYFLILHNKLPQYGYHVI